MLDQFLKDTTLPQAHLNLFNGLLEPYVKPPIETRDKQQFKCLKAMMEHTNVEVIKLVKRLRVFELEQSCSPQSHKRRQDDPDQEDSEGEKAAKRLR